MSLPSPLHDCRAGRIPLSERDPKSDAPADAAKSRGRTEWTRRLALLAERAPVSGPGPASAEPGEWEDIRPRVSRPLPAPDDVPPLPRVSTAGRVDPEREELELALAATQREIADREAENVGLRGALGAAHQQLRAREAEITDLTTRLAVAHATTSARQDELESLGGRYSGIEEARNALERETQVLREKLQRAAEEAEKRELKIDNLRSTRTTLEETIEARDRIIRARDEELAACEQELQAHRDRIANQFKNVADRESEIAMLQDQLIAEQERARQLELEVGARDQMLDHQREKLAERDEQLANLLATFDVVERTIKTRPGVSDLENDRRESRPDRVETSNAPAEARAPAVETAAALDEPAASAHDDVPAEAEADVEAATETEADPVAEEAPAEAEDKDDAEEREEAEEAPAMDASSEQSEKASEEQIEADEPGAHPADEPAEPDDPVAADVAAEEARAAAQAESENADEDDPEESPLAASEDEPSPADETTAPEADADAEATPQDDAEAATHDDRSEGSEASEDPFAAALHELEPTGDLFHKRPAPQAPIYRWWRDQRIAQSLAPLGVSSFDELMAQNVARLCEARPDDTISVVSLCGADPTLELRLARALEAAGHENYTIDCIDDREAWHGARDDQSYDAGFSDRVDSLAANAAELPRDQTIDVFIADGSLSNLADLPGFLGWLREAWKDDSVMVIGTPIGACAASEAPEHVETIDRIWNVMPDQYMHNHLTNSEQANFVPESPASDAPGSGGPLAPNATPLLPALVDEFCFEVFAPFGNLINAFVGPEIGANFDPEVEADRQFIETFAKLDEGQIDAGAVHPLHLVAVLRSNASETPFLLEGRAPERCLELGE